MQPVDEWTMIMRIALAAVMGLVIGLERERYGRAAGLRTCVVVACTGALLMSLSIYLVQFWEHLGGDSVARLDPARLPSYAIAGMGFLGAGAIIQGRASAIGVTTAAVLWTCTAIGLTVGIGLYLVAAATVIVALLSLTLLKKIQRIQRHDHGVNLCVKIVRIETHLQIKKLLEEFGADLRFTSRERNLEESVIQICYSLIIRSGQQWNDLLARLEEIPGLIYYSWEEAAVP